MANRPVTQLGINIKKLRSEMGITQKQFAEQFSEFCGRTKPYSVPAVSQWEINGKYPPMNIIEDIAAFFGVEVNELVQEDIVELPAGEEKDTTIKTIEINFNNLKDYHKMPVFLVFRDMQIENQWGLVDMEKNAIIILGGKMINIDALNKENVQILSMQPYKSDNTSVRCSGKSLTLNQVLTNSRVYIEMKSYDSTIKTLWDGIYTVYKEGLVNAKGGILPLTGCGISYNAYAL